MIKFKGYTISESFYPEGTELSADLGIFVSGWEDRSEHVAKYLRLNLYSAFVLNFENDGIPAEKTDNLVRLLEDKCDRVTSLKFPAANSRREWNGSVDRLFSDAEIIRARSLIVDYSCMPRSITQTILRGLVRKGIFARSSWLYSLGVYSDQAGNLTVSQGVKDFFPIRHTPGDGGMSSKRVAIVALGSDEGLIIEYLERYNFDRIFCICSESTSSPGLAPNIERILGRLSFDNIVLPEDIFTCEASSVIDCLDKMQTIVRSLDKNTSIEIFCSGPKSQSVAACILVEKYQNVRLMGRDVVSYTRSNVVAEGTISGVSLLDFSNPEVRFVL